MIVYTAQHGCSARVLQAVLDAHVGAVDLSHDRMSGLRAAASLLHLGPSRESVYYQQC